MDTSWLNDVPPDRRPAPVHRSKFEFPAALTSMHLSNALSDDTLLHALEPLLDRAPGTLVTFVGQDGHADVSLASSLLDLWLSSALDESFEARKIRYSRVLGAIDHLSRDSLGLECARIAGSLLMQAVHADMDRLAPDEVIETAELVAAVGVASRRGAEVVLRTMLSPRLRDSEDAVSVIEEMLIRHIDALDDELVVSALRALKKDSPGLSTTIVGFVDHLLDVNQGRRFDAVMRLDPPLAGYLLAERAMRRFAENRASS